MSKGFSKKSNSTQNVQGEDTGRIKKEFKRSEGDNTLFKEIQVDDITKVTDEKTRWKLDGDGIVWKACSSVESLYIIAKHKTEGIEVELDGVAKFKGLGNTISVDSWLGVENVKREAGGKPLLAPEDFEITQYNKLNYKTEDLAFEQVKIVLRTKLKNLRTQFQIKNIDFCIGEGECFRAALDLVEPYKGTRSPLRPIMLKKTRQWILDELNGEHAPEGFENDDFVEWFGHQGWLSYKKTGIFSFGVIAEDKDGFSNPKILVNFGTHSGKDNPKKGEFKFPKPWIISDTQTTVGGLDLVVKAKKDLKGYGLKWLIAQAFLIGDSADCYHSIKHLPKEMKKGIAYGDVGAYKDFVNLTTPKDVLQKVVDLYHGFFPYGVQYTSHKGEDLDVDTLTYMNTYFLVAYMTRSANDTMDFYKLCDAFKVDTSKIVGNNKFTAPIRTFVGNEDHIVSTQDLITSILKEDFKGIKTLKKADQAVVFDRIKEKLESIDWEEHYEMIQTEKVL